MNGFDFAVNMLYFALSVLLIALLFGRLFRYERKKSKALPIGGAAVFMGLAVVIHTLLEGSDIYSAFDLLLFGVFLITPYLLFVPKKKYVFFCFSGVISILLDYCRGFLLTLVSQYYSDRFETLVTVGECAVLAALLGVFGRRLSAKLPEDFIEGIHPAVYFAVFVAYLASFTGAMVGVDSLYSDAFSKTLNTVSSGLIIAVVVYLIYKYITASALQKETEMQLQTELNHYEDMITRDRDIRAFRHDYKNQLYALKAILHKEDIQEATAYVDSLYTELETTAIKFATGNYLADAILSEKNKTAEKGGNRIEFIGRLPENQIQNNDLCTVLSNTLDNALRACENNSPCTVKVEAQFTDFGGVITVSNPVKEKVEIRHNTVKTTKGDSVNHGLGIANVKKAAAKYGGEVVLSCTENEFTAEITLCFS